MTILILIVIIWLVIVGLRAPGRARKLRRGVAAQTAKLAELQVLAALPEAEKVRRDEAARRYEAMRIAVAKDGDTLIPALLSILGLIAFVCIMAWWK
jgi:16S rRNA C1402 N4-methylase RsmH